MKPLTRRRVLGHVVLAAAPALAAVEGTAPLEWPLRYGQRLGPLSLPVEAVAGLPPVILPPQRNQSASKWWLSTHPFDWPPAGISTRAGLAPWLPRRCLAWMTTQIATSPDS